MTLPNRRLLTACAAVLAFAVSAACAQAPPGALRSLAVRGQHIWAAGDRGTVLVSADAGETFEAIDAPSAANYRHVTLDRDLVYLLGGRGIQGHPEQWGRADILRLLPSKKTQAIKTGRLGWLYDGAISRSRAILCGEGNLALPAGLARSDRLGVQWQRISGVDPGHYLTAAFRDMDFAYAAGPEQRITSLRDAAQLQVGPPKLPRTTTLRGAAFLEPTRCWAVGDNATIVANAPTGRIWRAVGISLPGRTTRLADFESIVAASAREVWIAGGLTGAVAHTTTAAVEWRLLEAPRPGPIHRIVRDDQGALLACGNAGRIWRRGAGDGRWRLLTGSEHCDVLFIAAATDRSVFPAIRACALAGCTVEVVFATHLGQTGWQPAGQALQAAAAEAGAAGCTVISEFPSILSATGPDRMSEEEILEFWSRRIDVDSAVEMRLQLAAAIRLHRPRVLVTGPTGRGFRGARMETRLVSRLAAEGADLAGHPDAPDGGMARLHLPPWKPRRIFRGLSTNDQPTLGWEPQLPGRLKEAHVVIDQAQVPLGASTTLEMLTLPALSLMPGGPLDRPALLTGYRMQDAGKKLPLFTTGLTDHKLVLMPLDDERRELADGTKIRMAELTDQYPQVLREYIAAANRADKDDPLAIDRLMLLWMRLSERGRWDQADQALEALLTRGGAHPLYRRLNVLGLAMLLSSETTAARRREQAPPTRRSRDRADMVDTFGTWWAWSSSPPGRVLYASALGKTGRQLDRVAQLEPLVQAGAHDVWSRYAAFETAGEERDALAMRRVIRAHATTAAGTLDGRLDEDIWDQARTESLRPAKADDRRPAGTRGQLKVLRTPTHVILGLRLDNAAGQWRIDLAIDADRDVWTQAVATLSTTGAKEARLWVRNGPDRPMDAGWLAVQARRGDSDYTFEIAIPFAAMGVDRRAEQAWNLHLRAEPTDVPSGRLTLQRDPAGRLRPEYAAVLTLPAAPRPTTDQEPPSPDR